MKKSFSMVGIISMALVMGFFFTGCEEKESKIEYGSLTIMNLPSVPASNWGGRQVQWLGGVYFSPEKIESQIDVTNWIFADSNAVADFKDHNGSIVSTSPFSLMDSNHVLEGFLKSGTYMVHIQPVASNEGMAWESNFVDWQQYRAIMIDVTFKNGKATIDYNDMIRYNSLPYYK